MTTFFCVNPESLIILNSISSSAIQTYLDEALSLLAKKWSNHSRMGELYIYYDELDDSTFFDLKNYYRNLANRDRNLFNVLLHSFKCKKEDIGSQTINMQVKFFGQIKPYDRIYAYIHLNKFHSLSLPMQNWMKSAQITFVLIQNAQSNIAISNNYIDHSNIDGIERTFLPFELNDTEKFEKTKYQYHAGSGLAGVPIYRCKRDGSLWYEDRFHQNHFEVFDSRGQVYLGEAPKNLWGKVNPIQNAQKHPII